MASIFFMSLGWVWVFGKSRILTVQGVSFLAMIMDVETL